MDKNTERAKKTEIQLITTEFDGFAANRRYILHGSPENNKY